MKMTTRRSSLSCAACFCILLCFAPAVYAGPSWDALDAWEASLLPERPLIHKHVSTFSVAASLALPVPGIAASDAVLQRSFSYALSLGAAYGAKELGKHLFQRPRPDDPGSMDSFPSGHAAAAGAVMGYMAYYIRHDQNEPSWPAWASVPLHTLTVTGRLLSRQHYLLDIAAGLLLGGSIGYVVPLLLDL